MSSLSSVAQRTIAELDGLAVEIAYRRYLATLSHLTEFDASFRLPPRKYKVFISYRKTTGMSLAKEIHNSISNYANKSIFEPYLDEHELRLGDWESQIFTALEASDIFVPIVTEDYAYKGTISAKELERAFELEHEHHLAIAPIITFEIEKKNAVSRLQVLHALMLIGRSLQEAQVDLNSYLRIMAQTMAQTDYSEK